MYKASNAPGGFVTDVSEPDGCSVGAELNSLARVDGWGTCVEAAERAGAGGYGG